MVNSQANAARSSTSRMSFAKRREGVSRGKNNFGTGRKYSNRGKYCLQLSAINKSIVVLPNAKTDTEIAQFRSYLLILDNNLPGKLLVIPLYHHYISSG